jgi:hypothetical protein
MKALIMIATLAMSTLSGLYAQVTTGRISGRVFESDSTTVLPGAKVWVDTENGPVGVMCDMEGRYTIDALKPGVYNIHARFVGLSDLTVSAVEVSPDAITFLDLALSRTLKEVIVTWTPPLLVRELPRVRVLTEDIAHSPNIRNPKALLAGVSSDIQLVEGSGEVIIRGSRPGDAVYYVDGVKVTDLTALPGVAIGSMEAYTGGIPAKYGDTTGGVVILETKSYFDLYNAWLAGQ